MIPVFTLAFRVIEALSQVGEAAARLAVDTGSATVNYAVRTLPAHCNYRSKHIAQAFLEKKNAAFIKSVIVDDIEWLISIEAHIEEIRRQSPYALPDLTWLRKLLESLQVQTSENTGD
ncbi:TPA: hypothetical protein L5627_006003 [Pseudomonas aeruginosa]|nr:hypothetical protein [Pseudomonas aeruginosa]